MTVYNDALLTAIDAYLLGKTSRKFALLVIDEQGADRAAGELRTAMLATISFAALRGFKTITIEINPGMTAQSSTPTRASFRAIMQNPTIFYKNGFNAFGPIDGTGLSKFGKKSYGTSLLDAELRGAGINELIVLGRVAGQCVKNTVMGGREVPNRGPVLRGALQYGYQVWTSPKIIDGDATSWTGTKGIKCYSLLA
jgi:hypothetical protein